MKTIKQLIGLFTVVALLSSCSTSNKVITKNFVQKRKYNKGYYTTLNSFNKKTTKIDLSKNAAIKKTEVNNKTSVDPVSNELIPNAKTLIASTNKNYIPIVNIKSKVIKPNGNTILLNTKSEKKIGKIQKRINKKLKKIEKKDSIKTSAPSDDGKSQLVALLLVIFVGGLGIHRFYLGYIGIGVIQLLTLGGCGIWALIDLIRIATGDLKPNGGDYTKKL